MGNDAERGVFASRTVDRASGWRSKFSMLEVIMIDKDRIVAHPPEQLPFFKLVWRNL
jgi:hypothetical protein